MELIVKLLSSQAIPPARQTPGAAGYDLHASEACIVPPKSRMLVKTDIAVMLPKTTYGRIAPRSGMSVKGIDVAAGVVDSDYRGEVKVLLANTSDAPFIVGLGDRIAQLIITNIVCCPVRCSETLDSTDRGSGGFGSTGVNKH